MSLDLLLVNAPSRVAVYGTELARDFAAIEPPVWAGLIARHCFDLGFTVEILDAEAEGRDAEYTAWQIALSEPRLTAFCIYGQQPSASTQCLPAAAAVVRELKKLRPDLLTLALGTHPSALPERTLREEPFDFVVQGEGPLTIAALLEKMKAPGADAAMYLGDVPGLWWKTHNGEACPVRVPFENSINLDAELPSQAWDLLNMKRYRAHNWHLWTAAHDQISVINRHVDGGSEQINHSTPLGGYASVQTSLGCPFHCSFCCINAPFGGAGIRYWSPANVAAQIMTLVEKYGIMNIKIPDEMFCLNRQHVWQICNHLIDAKLGDRLNLWAYARVDTVKDEALLARMRAAGFRWLGIGVESGSKHVRDGVEKGRFGDDDIRAAIARVRTADLCVAANYIFGLPDDTRETMRATLDLACELNTEWANFYCAMAYPGSPLHKMAQEKGWPLPEGPSGPGWIGYSQHAYEALPLPTYSLTSAQVLDFRDEAFLKYFGRPEYLNMIGDKFGDAAGRNVIKMLSHGMPKRKHRDGP